MSVAIDQAEAIADELLDRRRQARERQRRCREAKRQAYGHGAKYADGAPCQKHPGALRYRSNCACVECAIERAGVWRKVNGRSKEG